MASESFASEKYVVQIAASRVPVNIPQFQKKYKLEDSVWEIKSADWYRYIIGEFDKFEDAVGYAEILKKNGLTDAYPRNIDSIEKAGANIQRTTTDTLKEILENQFPLKIDTLNDKDIRTTLNRISDTEAVDSTLYRQDESWLLWHLFKGENNSQISLRLDNFCDNYLPANLHTFGHRIVKLIIDFPAILLLLILIVVLILNLAGVFLVLYISNRIKNSRDRHIRIYKRMYEEALLSYFFGIKDWAVTRSKLHNISKPLNRRIFLSILLSVQENLKGGIDIDVPEIFSKLGLRRDATKLAESGFYYKKIEGIRQLTYLYPEGAIRLISNYINASNDLVRAEAQTSYVRLHHENPFAFFKELKKPFTRWTQLTAFNLLRLYNLQVDSFAQYLDSSHTNVRDFCLRMIIYYQQLENAGEVFRILESPAETTRLLAYRAINELQLFDGRQLIKARYEKEEERNRIEILKAFRNIGGVDDFDFLLSVIRHGRASEKIEACRSLYFVSQEGKQRLESLISEPELEIERYIAHIIDLRN
jgi:hypothetical protein